MLPDWDRRFPNCEPIGHHLRVAFADRWVRFHSLPDSKRYPEDETEYAELLARHNVVLGELAGPGNRVVLLTTGYSETSHPVRPDPELSEIDPGAVPWRTIAMHEADEAFGDPSYWHVLASPH